MEGITIHHLLVGGRLCFSLASTMESSFMPNSRRELASMVSKSIQSPGLPLIGLSYQAFRPRTLASYPHLLVLVQSFDWRATRCLPFMYVSYVGLMLPIGRPTVPIAVFFHRASFSVRNLFVYIRIRLLHTKRIGLEPVWRYRWIELYLWPLIAQFQEFD